MDLVAAFIIINNHSRAQIHTTPDFHNKTYLRSRFREYMRSMALWGLQKRWAGKNMPILRRSCRGLGVKTGAVCRSSRRQRRCRRRARS